jgi:hypothetical protein
MRTIYVPETKQTLEWNGRSWQIPPSGEKGDTGATGATGSAGTNGATGVQGIQGIQGTTGATGSQGIQGVKGDTGVTGSTGATGVAGSNGTNGAGVVTGGTAGQVLAKIDSTNYNTQWVAINGALDGWTPTGETWSYASANTITVPTGAANRYQKGDRAKWTQTTVKYGVIIAVADTLLTIAINADYVVTNLAISVNYYSHQLSPIGYPCWFNYTSVFGGFSLDPTNIVSRFKIDGNTVTVLMRQGAAGTSNANTLTFTVPVTAATITNASWRSFGNGTDNGAVVNTAMLCSLASNSNIVSCYKDPASAVWTTSSTKSITAMLTYEI